MKTKMPLFVVMTGFALIFTHWGSVIAGAQKLSTVSLNVTIEDTTSDQVTPTQVRSDALGSYSDGVDGVTAELGGNGNINILFWPSRGTPQRNVYFNHSHVDGQFFSGPLPGSPFQGGQIPPSGYGNDPHLYSHPPNPELATPYVAIQNMAVGTAQCVQFYWAWGYRDLFHYAQANTANTPTAFAVVSRDTVDQWTVGTPPSGFGCPVNDPVTLVVHDVATSRNQTTTVQDGNFYLPFRLTLRRKQ
jgi:hypothetical protein